MLTFWFGSKGDKSPRPSRRAGKREKCSWARGRVSVCVPFGSPGWTRPTHLGEGRRPHSVHHVQCYPHPSPQNNICRNAQAPRRPVTLTRAINRRTLSLPFPETLVTWSGRTGKGTAPRWGSQSSAQSNAPGKRLPLASRPSLLQWGAPPFASAGPAGTSTTPASWPRSPRRI